MSIVELLDAEGAPLLARPYFEQGDPGPIVAALAQIPELLEVSISFIGAVLGASSIDARTKELVILRTSVRLDCRYCVQSHTPIALDSGVTRAEVDTLRRPRPATDGFSTPRDRALVAWVDAIAGEAGPVDPDISTEMQAHFEDYEIVELTLLAGTTMMLNRFCTALELPTSSDALDRLAAEGFA